MYLFLVIRTQMIALLSSRIGPRITRTLLPGRLRILVGEFDSGAVHGLPSLPFMPTSSYSSPSPISCLLNLQIHLS